MNKQEILDLLAQSGLEAYLDHFNGWIFPSYEIQLEPEETTNLPLGTSRIGGEPDLTPDVVWPSWKGRNMSFVAQINLAELPHPAPLPSTGLLSFFYTVEGLYGDDDFYGDPHTSRVIYTPFEKLPELAHRPLPELAEDAVFKPNRALFSPVLSVPAAESSYLESIGLGWNGNREHFDQYWDFLEKYREITNTGDTIHRLLGHPNQIQGDMQIACEVMTTELTYDSLNDPAVNEQAVQAALKWRLLLQIDSDEANTGIMFGDVGRIYFWIREDDLAAQRFERVVCEMQCF